MSRPAYIIEEKLLRNNLQKIKLISQQADAEFILAFKAFALWKTFPILRKYIHHTTASSPWEAQLACHYFGSPAHTFSPAYEEDTFPQILQCSSHITFNSLSQLHKFQPILEDYNHRGPQQTVSIGLRINPQLSFVETDLYNPCLPGSRLGIPLSEIPKQLPEGVEGIHVHCLCESPAQHSAQLIEHLAKHLDTQLKQVRWLNLGGGHLVTRKDYDTQLLIQAIQELHSKYPHLKVILEPGSAFAWQTGYLRANVVDIVCNDSIPTATLNVSFACHMPDCLEQPYMPQVRGAEIVKSEERKVKSGFTYRLGGNSCLSGDYIGYWQFQHPLQVGDEIILEDMLHYTTVKTHLFNGIQHPDIALLTQDGQLQILRQFTFEDYLNRMD